MLYQSSLEHRIVANYGYNLVTIATFIDMSLHYLQHSLLPPTPPCVYHGHQLEEKSLSHQISESESIITSSSRLLHYI